MRVGVDDKSDVDEEGSHSVGLQPLSAVPRSTEKGLQLAKGPYAHWSTDGTIDMEDVIEDGLPPDQRAGVNPTRHVMLKVLVRNALHLPRMNHLEIDGTCDPFVSISYFDELYSTKHRTGTLDAEYGDTFDIFVHSAERTLALSAEAHSVGPAVKCECWDWNRTLGSKLIGTKEITLSELFSSPFPVEHTLQIFDTDGFPVKGADGNPTTITISFDAEEVHSDEPQWTPPTLEETLNCSEGLVRLHRAHRSAQTQNVFGRLGSVPDTRNDMMPTDMPGGYDEDGANMEDLIRTMNQSKQDVYWRERLNGVMESLWVSLGVFALIILDVSCIIFFDIIDGDGMDGEDPPLQIGITICVLSCFVLELCLRILAQRMRFWKQIWNVFDVLIIFGSVVLFVVKRVLQTADLQAAYSSMLRALSRTAMALRVMRVIINLRKARKLSGNVTQTLRSAVSQNRRRYTKLGFDLDLTYITTRVIAMSAPCFGSHSAYRNDIHIIARFLSLKHYGKFFIFNFCDTYVSSDGVIGNYHPQMLFDQVQRIPFEDHGPPLMSEAIQFCEEATRWLRRDPKNVVATHCKGGKGRTGVLCAVLLLWSGHRRCAMDAMELFTFRRSACYDPEKGFGEADDVGNNPSLWTVLFGKKITYNQGPEGPSQVKFCRAFSCACSVVMICARARCSEAAHRCARLQIRYVHYVEAMLYSGIDPLKQVKVLRSHSVLPKSSVCLCRGVGGNGGGCPTVSCYRRGSPVYLCVCVCVRVAPGFLRVYARAPNIRGMMQVVLENMTMPIAACHTIKPWYLSFTITCERYLVYDSFRDSHTGDSVGGSPYVILGDFIEGSLVHVPVGTTIWGDTRIDFFLHSGRKKKKRKLAFFVCFHTSFYEGKDTLSFLKNKVDKLCKNQHIPAEFELRLMLNQDATHEQLAPEAMFRKLFLEHGRLVTYKKHDVVLHERNGADVLLLIISGSVQGVVYDISDKGHNYHPLGCTIPFSERCRHSDSAARFPAIVMLGEGHVLGASQFLSGFGNMEFVARSDTVQVLELGKYRRAQDAVLGEDTPAMGIPSARTSMDQPSNQRSDSGLSDQSPRKPVPLLQGRDTTTSNSTSKSMDSSRGKDTSAVMMRNNSLELRRSMQLGLRKKGSSPMRAISLNQSSRKQSASIDLSRRMGRSASSEKLELDDDSHHGSGSGHRDRGFDKQPHVTIADILIDDMPEGRQLCLFYRGLALKLAQRLSVAHSESMRLSMLKSFNDRQSVLQMDDELEKLKVHAISVFDLPVNEKLLFTSKATYRCKDGAETESSTGRRNTKKIRLIVMSNYLILDPEIFGPTISTHAEVLLCHQLHSVAYKSDSQQNTLVLMVQGELVHGLELVANIREYEFTFHAIESVQQMSIWLREMCKKAHEMRERNRKRPFDAPHMLYLLEKCSKVHTLKKGGVLKEGSKTTSLFIVRTGCIKLKHEGFVYRCIRAGGCFGSTEFIEGTVSGKFACVASEKTVILELPPHVVSSIIERDHDHGSLFYWTLCQVMDLDFREAMEEMFPGTWSRNSGWTGEEI